jgi:hypothetical protein
MLYFEHATGNAPYIFVEVIPKTSDKFRLLIYWRYKPTNDTLSTHKIIINRSDKPNGDYTKVAEVEATQTYYIDEFFWHNYNVYPSYTLSIDDLTITRPVTVGNVPSPESLLVRKHNEIGLRMSGTPILVYIRKVTGERCSCFTAARGKVSDMTCPLCFGTGFSGGYYAPILTLGNITPARKTHELKEFLAQKEIVELTMSHFPLLSPRDLIVNLNKGTKWRIVEVDPSEDSVCVLHQRAVLARLNPSDVEYSIPLPDGTMEPILKPRKQPYIYNVNPNIKETTNGS